MTNHATSIFVYQCFTKEDYWSDLARIGWNHLHNLRRLECGFIPIFSSNILVRRIAWKKNDKNFEHLQHFYKNRLMRCSWLVCKTQRLSSQGDKRIKHRLLWTIHYFEPIRQRICFVFFKFGVCALSLSVLLLLFSQCLLWIYIDFKWNGWNSS